MDAKFPGYSTFQGGPSSCILYLPYIDAKEEDGHVKLLGFIGKMAHATIDSLRLNVTFVKPRYGTFGGESVNKSWPGTVGMLVKNEADVAPGPLVVTAQRVSVADPTVPYTYEEMVILGGRPKHFSSNLFSIALTFSPMFTRVESFQKVYRRLVEQGGALPAAQLFSLSTLQDIQAERAAMLFTRVAINRRLHRYCPMLHGEFYYARQPVTQVPMTTFVRKGLPRAVRRTLDAK
ncbi:hypothetical protein HPB52_008260 [Rhipicephalus sanguineus]|uniref:Ionotropic glutamate receptor L-glutamate and glycine-binding domain-containing protein n=1 Tax=Rhipicephalus sanguineus TaxID=34632 RepID=A0A9D4T1H9_RHISA|nr:hypothetical protein HPB52_008260 [Rhipicephalus sanguineus]